jgi:hypothetical protein
LAPALQSHQKKEFFAMKKPKGTHHHPIPKPLPSPIPELDLHEAEKAQPDWVQAELKAVRKYEDKILNALQDEENADLFAQDPGSFLRKLNIPISGAFRQRLRTDDSLVALKKAHCFQLPNGQHIRPRLRIRFTKEKEKERE